jgi:S-adenosylmethionine synthetase
VSTPVGAASSDSTDKVAASPPVGAGPIAVCTVSGFVSATGVFTTGSVGDDRLEAAVTEVARKRLGGLTPRGIREGLQLNKPIYRRTAAYGHFGRKPDGDFFPWEKTDLVEDLKAALG